MPLTMRRAPQGCVVLAVTNHPRHPGEEVEVILPIKRTGSEESGWLDGLVDVAHVGAFPAKQVIGQYNETSHQILSSATQKSFAGGGQITKSSESEDLDRYAGVATLETRFPGELMLLPLTVGLAGPSTTTPRILGDVFHTNAWHAYCAFGTDLCELTGAFPDTLAATDTTLNLTDTAVAPAPVFPIAGAPHMFIPQGAGNGYQTFDGTTLDAQVTAIEPISFMTHAGKIWALDGDGVLHKSVDGATWTAVVGLDPGHEPKSVVAFADRFDVPVPHIVTDSGVYAVDEGVPALYLTELNYAPSAYSGAAAEVWRTDLYAAIGMGVQRYTLGTVNAAGLDRDDGTGLQAFVSSLKRGFNDLFAGVSPVLQAGGPVEETAVDQGWEVYVGSIQDTAHVMRLTGGQSWHTLWRAPATGGTIVDLHVSRALDDSLLLWGWNGQLWASQLTRDFDNPRLVPTTYFDEGPGELISAWLDMNLPADRMTAAAIESRAASDLASGDEYQIAMQIDDDDVSETWRPVATVATPGLHQFRLGENGSFPQPQTPQTRYDGLGYSRLRYRIRMRRDPDEAQRSPAMESITVVYRPRMRRVRNFAFVVDCSAPEFDGQYGLGNAERREMLQALIESEVFLPMMHRDKWVMVQLPYVQGPEGTGTNQLGDVNVTALEAWETGE